MSKPEWGVKRTCLSCGACFYDMQRDPPTCPSCETKFDVEAVFRPRRARATAEAAKVAATAAVEPKDADVEDIDDDDNAVAAADDDDNDKAVDADVTEVSKTVTTSDDG